VVLSRSNITTSSDVGEHDERIYFVYELLKGQSLRAETACQSLDERSDISSVDTISHEMLTTLILLCLGLMAWLLAVN